MKKPVEINVSGSIIRPISVMPKSLQTMPVEGLYQEVIDLKCEDPNCTLCNTIDKAVEEVKGAEEDVEQPGPELPKGEMDGLIFLAKGINLFADSLSIVSVGQETYDMLVQEFGKTVITKFFCQQ